MLQVRVVFAGAIFVPIAIPRVMLYLAYGGKEKTNIG